MNLGLGVLEEKKKKERAPKARKRRRTDAGVFTGQVGAGFMDSGDDEEEEEGEKTGDSDSVGEEEEGGEGSEDGSDTNEEDSDEDSAEEEEEGEEEEEDDDSDSDSSTSSTDYIESNAHYPQQQGEQDNESARIDALLSVLGAESVESPQLLDRKRKRRHEERKVAQRDILAALLNIDTPPRSTGSEGADGGGGAKRKPVIEVVEVEGKE